MITAIDSVYALGNNEVVGKEEKVEALNTTVQIPAGEYISSGQLVHDNSTYASEALQYGQSNVKGRGLMLPLFDLHKDHDLDSLPSPTREAPLCFPVNKLFSVGDGIDRFGLPPAVRTEAENMELDGKDSKLHIYETDALKAVSTYQQKFSRSSYFTDDKFPSPTPSGDCEGEAVDTNDEVSSASIASSLTSFKPPPLDQIPVSSTSLDRFSMYGLVDSRIDATGSGSYPMKSSAKSRDPRLRFINPDARTLDLNQSLGTNNMPKVEFGGRVISRKQKIVEEPSLDATAPKRLRRSLENSEHNTREERAMAGKGGWFEENTVAGSQLVERNHLMQKGETELQRPISTSSSNLTVTSNGNELASVTSSSATASLPTSLLKNIAVNPAMLIHMLLEHQHNEAEAQKKPVDSATSTLHLTNSNSARGTGATVNTGPAMTAGLTQSSVGILPASSPATSMVNSFYEIISLN